MLLITPHVVRSLHTPGVESTEFASGTENEISTHSLRLGGAGVFSRSKSDIIDANARDTTKPVTATDVTGAGSAVDPTIAEARLDMVAPVQIPANKDFTLAVMVNSKSFESMQFDVGFDQDMEVIKVDPIMPTGQFQWAPLARGIHIDVGQSAAYSGPLAMITLRAKQATQTPITLSIQHPLGRVDNRDLLISTALPRPLTISP